MTNGVRIVLPRDFARAVDKDPSVGSMTRVPATTPGGHVIVRGSLVRFVLLDPASYAGTRDPRDFYRYVRRYASEPSPIGRVATPAVVWYMRLVIDPYELYLPKILRDLRAGVPWSTTYGARRIARRFGVADVVAQRLEALESVAQISKVR